MVLLFVFRYIEPIRNAYLTKLTSLITSWGRYFYFIYPVILKTKPLIKEKLWHVTLRKLIVRLTNVKYLACVEYRSSDDNEFLNKMKSFYIEASLGLLF